MGRIAIACLFGVLTSAVLGGCRPASPTSALPPVTNRSWVIKTIAGGPDGPATRRDLPPPCAMTAARGSLYLAGTGSSGSAVSKVSGATGRLTEVAGFGQGGFSPDGTLATSARLGVVCGLATDQHGNVVLADSDQFTDTGQEYPSFGLEGNHRIRVVAARNGTFYGRELRAGRIYTIAGDGGRGFAGDGGPALSARLYYPGAVAVDQVGNVVFADLGNDRIRVIAARSGTFYGVPMQAGDIYTVAGSGPAPMAGAHRHAVAPVPAGILALRAALQLEDGGTVNNQYSTLALDGEGDIVFGDTYAGGLLLLAARSGEAFGQPVKAGHLYPIADLGQVTSLAIDPEGNVLAAPVDRPPVVVAATTSTFYGQPLTAGHSYQLPEPAGVPAHDLVQLAVDAAGNLFEAFAQAIPGVAGGQVWMQAGQSGSGYGQQVSAGRFALVAGLPAGSATGPEPGQEGLPVIAAVAPAGAPLGWAGDFVSPGQAAYRIVVAAPASRTWFGQPMIAGHVYVIAGRGQGPGVPITDGALATTMPVSTFPNISPVTQYVTQDAAGNVLFADGVGGHVWAVAGQSGLFYGRQMTAGHLYSVVVSRGVRGPGVTARSCREGLNLVAADKAGNLVIGCDTAGLMVVAARDGTFYGQVMRAGSLYPLRALAQALSVDPAGNLVTLSQGQVRVIASTTGRFYGQRMRAGQSYTVDAGPVGAVASDPWGNVLVASESQPHPHVQVVADRSGTFYGQPMRAGQVYLIAGSAPPGLGGDGGPAAHAALDRPDAVAYWPGHGVLVEDDGTLRLIYPPPG